ncbi:MAG: DUF547 domain-containing protein [Saprospiraceae bacterium]|nr:DUF547 domain-containing protein [Saprospiraceae bacterium]
MFRNYLVGILTILFYPGFSQADLEIFNRNFKQILDKHLINDKLDYDGMNSQSINELYQICKSGLKDKKPGELSVPTSINLYNFLIIYKIKEAYPVKSVMDIPGFFTDDPGISPAFKSLDALEKLIVRHAGTPLVHVLLNCGAISCPPLQFLEENSSLESYIYNSFNDSKVINYSDELKTLFLSRIFFWNKDDFDQLGNIREWIKEYITRVAADDYVISYMDYNWQLNDLSTDDYLYIYPTKLFRKGGFELKVFNNYYTQDDNGLRSNFFSSFIQLLIGTNKNFNIGFDIKLRSVNQGNVGLFSALNFSNQPYYVNNGTLTFSRFGISGIGPRIKYQPFKDRGNINILHAVYFVPMDNTEGSLEYGYFDFQNLQIFNNLWYEKEFSVKKRLFIDIGFHIENLKPGVQRKENHFMQALVPFTGIYSYYPNPKTTFYVLGNYAQKVQFQFDLDKDTDISFGAFGQLGTGMKYYLTEFLEIEGLYTYFVDTTPGRTAHTFNVGLRWFK